jgi:hydroxyacyl-ACP dehydratase HTD2-like protein with hotdog domain
MQKAKRVKQQLQALCNCLCMMMARPHPSLIYMCLLQNFAKGSIVYDSYKSLGGYDLFFLIMLEGKHYTYEGASLARTYNNLGVIDEETTMNLKRV